MIRIFREDAESLNQACKNIWSRPIPKAEVQGIHGLLFYQLEAKKVYYPTRKDEEAKNPGD